VLYGLAGVALATSTGGSGRAGGAADDKAAQRDQAISERRAVLDALRPAVEARLGPSVEFVVQTMNVAGGWAFVVAEPRRKSGTPIDGRAVFGDDFDNMDGLRIDAVLRRQRAGWTLIDHSVGATDVWYCDVGPREIEAGLGC
jgi:hypothetical protein